MTYVYDLILNFNNEIYEFYEWKKDDNIHHIKRINLIRVSSKNYNEIMNNKVKFDDTLLLSIFNRCEYFENRNVNTLPYALLVTDNYRVVALLLDNDGYISKYSSLLLDEEEDILDISERLPETKIEYKIVQKLKNDTIHTRGEKNILRYIKKDLNKCYKENNLSKLKYLYYEYFNKQSDDIKEIYERLTNELTNQLNDKHYNLYNLIKLSYTHKSV